MVQNNRSYYNCKRKELFIPPVAQTAGKLANLFPLQFQILFICFSRATLIHRQIHINGLPGRAYPLG